MLHFPRYLALHSTHGRVRYFLFNGETPAMAASVHSSRWKVLRQP
jgi:hypothetical protein